MRMHELHKREELLGAPAFPAAPGAGVEARGAPPLHPAADVPATPANGPAVRTYEELDGGEGRAVFFRPHRYAAADLAPLRASVEIAAGGERRECPLRDVSQNGAAFAWPREVPVEPKQRLAMVLRFDGLEAFRGEAVVGSVREQDGTLVVGVSFVEFLLDVDEVLQLRTVQDWAVGAAGTKPWAVAGCSRYKALLSELRLFFEDTKRRLEGIEARLPWHVLHGKENAARAAIVSRLRADFVPDAVRLSEEIDEAVRELPGGHRDPAAREWSSRTVDEYFLQSPGCHRARHKPFGYPGDYEVMNFIYGAPFDGATLFARAVELAFWHSRSAFAVRARKDLVKRELRALLAGRRGSGKTVRVLSVASGSAQELVELLAEVEELEAPLEVTLFEQDKNALAHAWRRLEPAVAARFPGRVRFTFLHDSIKRLLRDPDLFAPFGEFDLVYSAGLLDYLAPRSATGLTRNLVGTTAPGGRVLVANMVDHPARWFLEVPLDWPLVYRTRDEMLEIGRHAAPGARARLLEEESGANPFLELVRP